MPSLETLVGLPVPQDLVSQMNWQRECLAHVPEVELVRVDRVTTKAHDLYHDIESKDIKWKPPVLVRAYIDMNPSIQRLKKYGIDEDRELMVKFSTLNLGDVGVLEENPRFLIGDTIRYSGDQYTLLTQSNEKDGYWANTSIPFHITCTAQRLVQGS